MEEVLKVNALLYIPTLIQNWHHGHTHDK
jgi:hypothetical protein